MTLTEMMEERARQIYEARKLYELAEKEKREVSAEERQKFDELMDKSDVLKGDIDRLSRADADVADLEKSQRQVPLQQQAKPDQQPTPPQSRTIELRTSVMGDVRSVTIPDTVEHDKRHEAFNRCLVEGTASAEREYRALQKDSPPAGGYLSGTEQFQAELIQSLDNLVWMRQLGRVLPPLTTADSLGAPSLDTDPADPTWVGELSIGGEDSTMALGKRSLTPHPLAQFIKVSKTLLRRSTISADALVRERLAYKRSVVEENAFLNGSGAIQPLGVFTASADGITTSQDVSTGNTATEMRTDGLINALYDMPAQYRQGPSVAWIFHRSGVKQIRKLKDGEGRYLWQQSIVAGEPDVILGKKVFESEYAPSTFTTGLYVGIIGNFQFYWIVDALTATIQVLVELYAAANQNGYLSRSEGDGMPVLAAAFRRVKLA